MALRFYSAVLFVGSVPAFFFLLGPLGPLLTIVLIPAVLVAGEYFAPYATNGGSSAGKLAFRVLPWLYIPLQLIVTAWALWIVTRPASSWWEFTILLLSIGLVTGVFGMMAAHEMIHSKDRRERWLGLAMLTGMSYRHFSIAHVHGHHRHAATERDPATARLAESFYAFVPRTMAGQFVYAWRHEEGRRARKGSGLLVNRVFRDLLLMAAIYVLLGTVLGPKADLFFVGESAVAILALELFNYVAHYGLVRGRDVAGNHEPFTDRHSWNASNSVGNAVLFNMGRHSDHHRRAASPYQILQPVADAPELPAGYAGSMLLALIPPLWRRVMDRRVRQVKVPSAG